ncbi:MAG: TDT family transporter, partial [Lachnospiraceae bacterium]|nr:TDT family transporter [Lachnospiraceae bacterium]
KKVPVPVCGVMLGCAALGNLLQAVFTNVLGNEQTGNMLRLVCGVLALILLVLMLLKIITCFGAFQEDLKNPIMASVFATFPMTLMILSTYLMQVGGAAMKPAGNAIWWVGIALHALLIVYFTVKFMLPPALPKVFASYFIVYCGIAAGAVTAPPYGQEQVGTILFWFAFVCFVALMVLVTMAYMKTQKPDPAKPLICIYTAPLALCIAGYVQSVTPKSLTFLQIMLAVECVLYLFALYKAVMFLIGNKFFPSWASFTFPFVISAIATLQTMACAKNMEQPMPFLRPVVLVETVIAVVFVLYVYIRFLMFLTKAQPAPAQPAAEEKK